MIKALLITVLSATMTNGVLTVTTEVENGDYARRDRFTYVVTSTYAYPISIETGRAKFLDPKKLDDYEK